jgi:hypothetical protein
MADMHTAIGIGQCGGNGVALKLLLFHVCFSVFNFILPAKLRKKSEISE